MMLQESLAFRAKLGALISPLRRVRPRVPFYQLLAHRIPTLRLYRGLLREAPTDDIRFRIRSMFRRNQHLTGTQATKKQLLRGYKFLETFKLAHKGDTHAQALLHRYSSFIAMKRAKAHWVRLARAEVAWQARLRNRPILTGGFLRPTVYNPPLPRMKPQPLSITMIIAKRRRVGVRRQAKLLMLKEQLEDLQCERVFEEGLATLVGEQHKFEPVYNGGHFGEWVQPVRDALRGIHNAMYYAKSRAQRSYTPEMLAMIKQARREKIANKTRELERERRGEVIARTIKRRNKGPPAHVLSRMSDEERRLDKIARSSVSEVGYVGLVKRRLGFKLRDPERWKAEGGWEADKQKVDEMMRSVERENERRRQVVERAEKEGSLRGTAPYPPQHP